MTLNVKHNYCAPKSVEVTVTVTRADVKEFVPDLPEDLYCEICQQVENLLLEQGYLRRLIRLAVEQCA